MIEQHWYINCIGIC